MFATISQIFKPSNKDLRHRVLFTLAILSIFCIGTNITVPWANAITKELGFLELFNLMAGGGLKQFSIFALGVTPYITATIITQLLQMDIIPYFSELKEQGYVGKQKINKINRYLGILFAFVQGYAISIAFLGTKDVNSILKTTLVLTAGTSLLMWLGDQITQKGIGNGVSLLIFTGIVSNLPNAFLTTYDNLVTYDSGMWLDIAWYVLFVVVYLSIVVFVVFTEGAIRKIPVNYASSTSVTMRTREQTHMPIKINSSGVLPVIFASSVLAAPRTIVSFMKASSTTKMINTIFNYQEPVGFCLYILMIIGFTFFYSNLQIDAEKISDDLKKNGGSIPGVRTGIETKNFIKRVLNQVTVAGSLTLCIIAAIPIITPIIWTQTENANLSLGGTGLIIVTGVALETVKQIKTYITRKEYHGYIRK